MSYDHWCVDAGPDPQLSLGESWVCMCRGRVHIVLCRKAKERAVDVAHANVIQALSAPPMQALHAVGRGPRAALLAWSNDRLNVGETRSWMEDARLEAILGGCRRSLDSVRSVCIFS